MQFANILYTLTKYFFVYVEIYWMKLENPVLFQNLLIIFPNPKALGIIHFWLIIFLFYMVLSDSTFLFSAFF